MLVSARPIGSTVRLRDPAQADRQGSHPQSCHGGRAAEREGMEWHFCRLPASVPAAWALPVLLCHLQSLLDSLPVSLLPLILHARPLGSRCSTAHAPYHRPGEEKAQRLKPPPEVLSLACPFPVPSYSSSWKWGLRRWGLRLREPAANSLLADLSAQGKDDGSCAPLPLPPQ